MRKRLYYIILFLVVALLPAAAATSPDDRQARQVFDRAWAKVFGPEGSSLTYDVNIVGFYKTHGDIWFKGSRRRFRDNRVDAWSDGRTTYMVHRRKKTIEIHRADSEKRDKYSSKFKFTLDDFSYSMKRQTDGILLTLKQKRGAKGTIKEVKALIDADTYAPRHLKLKVMFFWTNVKISRFQSGGISDHIFVFPRSNYGPEYKVVDKRKEK